MHFHETQRFRQWWVWALFIVAIILPFNREWLKAHVSFLQRVPITGLHIIPMTILAAVMILFLLVKLETGLDEAGVYYRFFPLQLKTRHRLWNEINRAYIRTYSPIIEYGGWGFRIGLFGKGGALNISGKIGLQLEFKDGKRLLLGTNNRKELDIVMQELYKKGVVKDATDSPDIKDRY